MKHTKQALILMFFALIYINIIEEVKSTSSLSTMTSQSSSTSSSLAYFNSKLSSLVRKAKSTKAKGNSKGGKGKKGKKKKEKLICKKIKGGKKRCYDALKYPYGPNYMKAPNNNVHVITINFYVRLLKMIGDTRDFATLSKTVSRSCNHINIFKPMRESLLNCRAIQKRIKKNRDVTKTFYIGCMANLFRVIKDKCSHIWDKKSSGRNMSEAIHRLTRVEPKYKHRFQVDANIFIKKLSFFMRLKSDEIHKRYLYLNKIRAIALKKKLAEIARQKKLARLAKLAEKKRLKTLKLCKLGKIKNKKKCLAAKKKPKKKVKKVKKIQKKKLFCKKACKKGQKCTKVCKKIKIGKFVLRKNTKADKKFVKLMKLSSFKGQTIAALIGKWGVQIDNS